MAQSPINRPLWSHCPFLRQKSPRCVSKFNDFVKIISKLSFSFRIFLLCGEKNFGDFLFVDSRYEKFGPLKWEIWILPLAFGRSLSLSLFLFLNLLLSSFRSLLYLVLLCLLILFLLLFCQSRNDQFLAYFYANCMRSI